MPVSGKLTGSLRARKDTAAPAPTAATLSVDRPRARSSPVSLKTDKKIAPLPKKEKQPVQAPPSPLKEKQPAQAPPSPLKEKQPTQAPPSPLKDKQPAQAPPSPSKEKPISPIASKAQPTQSAILSDSGKQPVKDTKVLRRRPSVMNITKLTQDGRKRPEYFKKIATEVSSPSKISIGNYTEFYQPGDDFINTEDVYTYRGYKKISKLDEGAFGAVYKGMRVSDKLPVAIKEVDISRRTHKRLEEMRREVFVLQKVDSPYIVKLIEHFVWYNTYAIIMEFCQGNNVTSYLKDEPLPADRSRNWFRQMCTGIKVLHRLGIAHRDIKLNNFLVDKEQIKVADFGLAIVSYKPRYGMKICKTFCGTEPYMAPEIIHRSAKGYRHYNPYSGDVWALGVCLYAMTTRTFPFKMLDINAIYKLQRARKWKIPKDYREQAGEDCCDLIYHLLDPDPDRRISLIGALSHPWLNNDLVVLTKEDS